MHIADGALSGPVLIGGAVLAVAGTAVGLRKLDMETMPVTGVLSATFFVASLVHIPVGATSVHLIMNGLAGLVLGWAAFPALAVALLLQAVFFGFGGLTVLGVNTFNIAAPAVLMHYLCRQGVVNANPRVAALWGGISGAGAILATTVLVALSLALSGDQFLPAARLTFLIHIPVMVIEALVSAAAVFLVWRVRPELFDSLTQLKRGAA
ncbi:cobalt transporter CbiM [Pseudoroseicyclus tamaricis]|uniref:Cobalt transporter CbiM n=1 Tax=Pseudoroseicyclus tamaricis TaxID=2705421 RepID=A0A6B2JQM8_9RHOB|nr:cobalt transporter CbiM [Pseudoroseicyclus tamaricis]NDV00275.1 cobalt transporter CbiM [Pseudoroseicyclus tamaricis]